MPEMESELLRLLRERRLSPEDREERRQTFQRLAAEDLSVIDQLTIERQAAAAGNPLTGARIRSAIFRAAEVYDLVGRSLPRGYRVLGNGAKTPYYLQRNDNSRPTDAELVADALSGWLQEVAETLAVCLRNYKQRQGLIPPDAAPGEGEADDA
jgi:hypothetical protein